MKDTRGKKVQACRGDTALIRLIFRMDDGKILDPSKGQPLFLVVGEGWALAPEIERVIIGMQPGQERTGKISMKKVEALFEKEICSQIRDEALIFDVHLIDIVPRDQAAAEEHYGKGLSQQSLGCIDDAISSFKKAIMSNPGFPAPYIKLGSLFQERGYLDEAIVLYQQALELCPDHSDTYNILGSAFQASGEFDEALVCYQKAVQQNPNAFTAYNNLGSVLKLRGDIEGAIRQYQTALHLNPNFPEALNNLGNALRDKNQLDNAEACYRKSIALRPTFADPHLNFAYTLLLAGRFEEGWEEYEWRWKIKEPIHTLSQPLWDGSDIAGQRILLYAEQGMGDTIHSVRYASLVAERGLKVIIGCQKELKTLMESVQGVDQVIAFGELLPQFDVQCPLMSLPGIFRTTLASIPLKVPYIYAQSRSIQQWNKKLSLRPHNLNIGLAWAGSPGHINDRNRSIPLAMFYPLSGIEGISLFSLQKELPEKTDRDTIKKLEIIDYTDDIDDFSDTAGIIMNLDLVVSVDTSVAHLAGALGKNVWTLLPYAPDWRWLLNREDSPWYPTMRLLRQPSAGDWKTVIDQTAHALRREYATMRSP